MDVSYFVTVDSSLQPCDTDLLKLLLNTAQEMFHET